jgi:hypothetical protein
MSSSIVIPVCAAIVTLLSQIFQANEAQVLASTQLLMKYEKEFKARNQLHNTTAPLPEYIGKT